MTSKHVVVFAESGVFAGYVAHRSEECVSLSCVVSLLGGPKYDPVYLARHGPDSASISTRSLPGEVTLYKLVGVFNSSCDSESMWMQRYDDGT